MFLDSGNEISSLHRELSEAKRQSFERQNDLVKAFHYIKLLSEENKKLLAISYELTRKKGSEEDNEDNNDSVRNYDIDLKNMRINNLTSKK